MNSDDVAAETIDLPGGPVIMTRHELLLHRVQRHTVGLQVGFTPEGDLDIPSGKPDADAQAERHAAAAGEPLESDDHVCLTHIALDAQVWRDMGEPNTITVSVWPGDRLNEQHAQDDMGPVTEVQHIAGPGAASMVRHKPAADDRPMHDERPRSDAQHFVDERTQTGPGLPQPQPQGDVHPHHG